MVIYFEYGGELFEYRGGKSKISDTDMRGRDKYSPALWFVCPSA